MASKLKAINIRLSSTAQPLEDEKTSSVNGNGKKRNSAAKKKKKEKLSSAVRNSVSLNARKSRTTKQDKQSSQQAARPKNRNAAKVKQPTKIII